MKKLTLLLLMPLFFLGCSKKKMESPEFTVYGLQGGTIVNNGYGSFALWLTVDYINSSETTHEQVKLAVSGLPQHLYLDTTWLHSGYPPYNTKLLLRADPSALIMPGTYYIRLTATSDHMVTKTYQFRLLIPYPPSCTAGLVGKYYNCHSYCSEQAYEDSVYADPLVMNKVWFTNFNNTGMPAYGLYDCSTNALKIPVQLVDGTIYSGGYLIMYDHKLNFPVNIGSDQCVIDMY